MGRDSNGPPLKLPSAEFHLKVYSAKCVVKTMLEAFRPRIFFILSAEQGCQLTFVSDESLRTDNRIFFQLRCKFSFTDRSRMIR